MEICRTWLCMRQQEKAYPERSERGSSGFSELLLLPHISLLPLLLFLPCIKKCFMESLDSQRDEIISTRELSCATNLELLNLPFVDRCIPSYHWCCRHSCRPCAESPERQEANFSSTLHCFHNSQKTKTHTWLMFHCSCWACWTPYTCCCCCVCPTIPLCCCPITLF